MQNKNIVFAIIMTVSLYGSVASNPGIMEPNNSCPYPTFNNQIAQRLLTRWGNDLQKYNAAHNSRIYNSAGYFVMNYYAPGAILQPTISPVQREGTQAIYDYFIHFLSSNPIMHFNPESNEALSLGCGFGGYVGYYSFVINPGTSQESNISARFTFDYVYLSSKFIESFMEMSGSSNEGGQVINYPGWYILVQQSSILPSIHN